MTDKSISATNPNQTGTSRWGALLLGALFILVGLFLLGNSVFATVISAIVIGILLLIAGASEIFQAFSAPKWSGFFLRLLIGALYGIGGVALIADPLAASIFLTFVFGVALIASGLVRIVQAFQYWKWSGWLLLFSGIVGILAGLIILAKWPISGLWVLGFVVGIDLILHGAWWLGLGLQLSREPQAAEP